MKWKLKRNSWFKLKPFPINDSLITMVVCVCVFSQTVSGVWGWPPTAAVWRCSFRGHWLAGIHLYSEGATTCAAPRWEAQVPQHRARSAGWDICGEVKQDKFDLYVNQHYFGRNLKSCHILNDLYTLPDSDSVKHHTSHTIKFQY